MKLIKLLSFIFLISSCNDYLGTVEPDYIPKNEISEVIDLLELNGKIYRTNPYGEPFLSKYNLYPNVNFNKNKNNNRKSYILNLILKILSLSNGKHDLFDLSNIIGISIFEIIDPIKELTNKKIIYLK